MESYEITVWYRYVSHGEQEKDFQTHDIKANSVQDAVNSAKVLYDKYKCIPYAFYCENVKYQPTN